MAWVIAAMRMGESGRSKRRAAVQVITLRPGAKIRLFLPLLSLWMGTAADLPGHGNRMAATFKNLDQRRASRDAEGRHGGFDEVAYGDQRLIAPSACR